MNPRSINLERFGATGFDQHILVIDFWANYTGMSCWYLGALDYFTPILVGYRSPK